MLPKPTEEDYYIETSGRMVFTEKYHLKRGYCCGNNCRHCPYNYENVTDKQTKTGEKTCIKRETK